MHRPAALLLATLLAPLGCVATTRPPTNSDLATAPSDLAPPWRPEAGVPVVDAGLVDLLPGFDRDGACARVSSTAKSERRPVDVVFVIDNSGSMTDEIRAIERNINTHFAAIIEQSGIDWRVILVSRHGSAAAQQSICITAPLSGAASCSPPPAQPINGPRFFHYSVEILSTDAWQKLLDTWDQPDEFQLAPHGWSEWARADSIKSIIVITDDNSNLTAAAFDQALLQLKPARFGDAMHRRYFVHTIAGLRENRPPTTPWQPEEPLQMLLCTKGGGAVANGIEYQKASQLTGGLRFPICEHQSFDALFEAVARGVVTSALAACEFTPPPPPPGQQLVWKTLIVDYAPGMGPAQSLRQVPSAAECAPDCFYVDQRRIYLCPETCRRVKADAKAKIEVLFDCTAPM